MLCPENASVNDSEAIFINTKDGKRTVDWNELHQLKKDILWIYDENAGSLKDPFIPHHSFKLKYWEYVTLYGNKILSESEIKFYKKGALIITLCMAIDFIDTLSGNQQIFGTTKINDVQDSIKAYEPITPDEIKLKDVVALSLSIADSMTIYDNNSFGYTHPDMDKLNQNLIWVDDTFIKSYFNR
jgi:hypothetical protein